MKFSALLQSDLHTMQSSFQANKMLLDKNKSQKLCFLFNLMKYIYTLWVMVILEFPFKQVWALQYARYRLVFIFALLLYYSGFQC